MKTATRRLPDPAAKILRVRAEARAALRARGLDVPEHDKCPTCCKPAASPHRRYDARGKVVEGCVDAHHSTGNLIGESAFWHHRADAIAIRRAEGRRLEVCK